MMHQPGQTSGMRIAIRIVVVCFIGHLLVRFRWVGAERAKLVALGDNPRHVHIGVHIHCRRTYCLGPAAVTMETVMLTDVGIDTVIAANHRGTIRGALDCHSSLFDAVS